MVADFLSEAALPAERLRLVRFYLPRLLATEAHPSPEHWWFAFSLWQLGETALYEHSLAGHLQAAESQLLHKRLYRLQQRIWDQLCIPAHQRTLSQETISWEQVQLSLMQTMPLVECLLTAALAAGPPAAAGGVEGQLAGGA